MCKFVSPHKALPTRIYTVLNDVSVDRYITATTILIRVGLRHSDNNLDMVVKVLEAFVTDNILRKFSEYAGYVSYKRVPDTGKLPYKRVVGRSMTDRARTAHSMLYGTEHNTASCLAIIGQLTIMDAQLYRVIFETRAIMNKITNRQ